MCDPMVALGALQTFVAVGLAWELCHADTWGGGGSMC